MALARTYGGDYDGWERLQEYNWYLEYSGRHPNKGSASVASALELPRSRVRPWTNGSIPDPVRAIQTAAGRGWLDLEWDGDMLRAFTVAVAWIFSGGGINQTWEPGFAVERETRWLAEDTLDQLGVGHTPRHTDTDGRATELLPAADATVLGRLLVALGAPQGPKGDDRLLLPPWLSDAPESIRLVFARTYITNRGTPRDDRPEWPVAFREVRGRSYRQSVQELFESLVEGQAVGGDSETLYLTPAGAARLNQYPDVKN